MPSGSKTIIVGEGIAAGSPFTLDQFLYVSSVSPAEASSFPGLVRGTNAVEAPGTQAARANHNTLIGTSLSITNLNAVESVLIGTDIQNSNGSTPVTATVAIGKQIRVGQTAQIAIGNGGNSAMGNSAIGIGSGFGGIHNNMVAIGFGMTLGGSFNGVQIGDGSSTSTTGSGSVVIGNSAQGGTNTTVVGGACAGATQNDVFIGQNISITGGGGTNDILIGGQLGGVAVNNAITIGNGASVIAGTITLGNANLGGGGFSTVLLIGGALTHTSGTAVPAFAINMKNAAGTDVAAGDLTITGPRATGNAASANIDFDVGVPGASGTTLATAATILRLETGATGATFGFDNTDRNTLVNVGNGGAAPTANRTAALRINSPDSVGNPGSSELRWERDSAGRWTAGIDNTTTGAKTANTDWFLNQGGTNLLAVSNAGRLNLVTGGTFAINNTQVVQARVTGWGAGSNGSRAALDGATATLAQTSAAVAQLIIDLTTHGLIGA